MPCCCLNLLNCLLTAAYEANLTPFTFSMRRSREGYTGYRGELGETTFDVGVKLLAQFEHTCL